MIYSGTINADRFILFLEQLIKDKGQKIVLILDNLRVHHSKIVKQWAKEKQEYIELLILPSYSPKKNSDEYLNRDLKYALSEKPAPKNEKQLEENVYNPMKMLTLNSDRVAKYFKHKDIKYTA